MFKNMKIGLRLALGFCLLIGFMILIIIVSINQMAASHDKLDRIVKINSVCVQSANGMIADVREVSIAMRTALLFKDTEKAREIRSAIAENRKVYDDNLKKVKELTPSDDTAAVGMISKVKASQEISRALNNDVLDLAVAGKHSEAFGLMTGKASPAVGQWIENVDDLVRHSETRTALRYDEANIAQENARTFMYLIGAVAIVLALAIAIFLTLGIIRPLRASVNAANMIASKNLTVELSADKKRGDELGDLLRSLSSMGETLREQIQGIQEAVNTLISSSSEILAATTQVASGTAENAFAIGETTTTVEEVRQAAQLSSDKAKNVSDSAQRVSQVFQSGKKAVEEAAAGMLAVRGQMEAITRTIVSLSEQGQSIGGIIASVSDIADQSNLLAVNAAIEAARAGEQGKGFAVVAQEIKNLAEQSKQATGQVRTILGEIQKATAAAVLVTEQGGKAVDAGAQQSTRSSEAIDALMASSGEAVQAAIQIVASSQQQVVGMNQIGTAMENINQAGSETAASMKQAEITAKNLYELGQKLKGTVEQFKV